jgi:ClpP class serine protease
MASSAYWLGSAAKEVVVYPTSMVGSIGVYTVHTDTSGLDEKAGIKRTILKAGDQKAAHLMPLTDDTRTEIQSKVDLYYDMFLSAVASHRGSRLTKEGARATQARSYVGEEAIGAGLADRMATLAETVRGAGGPSRSRIHVSAFVPADNFGEKP